MKTTTLVYIMDEHDRVLLAVKKRSHGAGKWNGPGGKVETGETPEECAIRETKEEFGLTVSNLEARGVLEFIQASSPIFPENRCYIFVTKTFSGVPIETAEMGQPTWFPINDVPYADMWEDDAVWLNTVLTGGHVSLRFYFDEDNHLVSSQPL